MTNAHSETYTSLVDEAPDAQAKGQVIARWVLSAFDEYYLKSRQIPALAQKAFERQEAKTSITLSKQRLSMYSTSVETLSNELQRALPEIARDTAMWSAVEVRYLASIRGRYEADLAFAYIHSVRRLIDRGEWRPVEYAFGDGRPVEEARVATVHVTFPVAGEVTTRLASDILAIPGFEVAYRDMTWDAERIAERANALIKRGAPARSIEMIDAGFYRNRGAYLVGRLVRTDERVEPFVIALLNGERGIYTDAVLDREADAHNIFSSTLANFHVTSPHYRELSVFLHSIMPKRPLGLHYSTIGFNHVGKVAVMSELKSELLDTGDRLHVAVGFRGTVAIGFSSPSSAYNLKVIRNEPTRDYKWGEFEGIASVLEKYRRVHDINRTGSMLDDIIYLNLKLDKSWFDPELLSELLEFASDSASLHGEAIVFKYLIVQRRMTPLPVFLQTASEEDARTAIINLGYCIKNNAAANIFNKDLDARNYGVSRLHKVYLYDYDALEPVTDIKIRTNSDRIDGEEEMPDWYFEDGVVFLPEEIESGLRIPNRTLRQVFRQTHGDLMTVEYWQEIQERLRQGQVPSIRIYPGDQRLRPRPD